MRMHPFAKLIYFYLKTGHRSLSGIYVRSVDEIAFKTGVEKGDALHLLTTGAVIGVEFDTANHTVFIQDKLADSLRLGGNPEWNAKSILNDYYSTMKSRDLWLLFKKLYRDYVAESSILAMHFEMLEKRDTVLIKATRSMKETGKKRQRDDDVEPEIQTHLARYTTELDEVSRDLVFEVYEELTSTKAGKPLDAKTRLKFLHALSRFPVDYVLDRCRVHAEAAYPGRTASRQLFLVEASASHKRKETR